MIRVRSSSCSTEVLFALQFHRGRLNACVYARKTEPYDFALTGGYSTNA